MGKRNNWLIKQWLDEWQQLTTTSRWHRGKMIYQQNRLIDVKIKEGQISGVVKGSEVYDQYILCEKMECSSLKKVKEAFLNDPFLVMMVYLKAANVENLDEPVRSAFSIPKLKFRCTCPDEVTPCKHLVAVALAAASKIETDPANFLLFRGIPWNDILQSLGSKETANEVDHNVNYSMVPLPLKDQYTPIYKKGRFSPPFWVSPFPFALMMEEIYTKVGEGIDEDEIS